MAEPNPDDIRDPVAVPFNVPFAPASYADLAQGVVDQPPASAPPPPVAPKPRGILPVGRPPSPQPTPQAGPDAALPKRTGFPTPPKPEYNDPLMSLGQPLTMLAVLGSMFVRNSATTALNSLASAAEAKKKGDQVRFENSYQRYQMELRKAEDEFKQEQSEYDAILANKRLTLDEQMAKFRTAALKRGNNAVLSSIGDGSVANVIEARRKAGKPVSDALLKEQMVEEKMKGNPNLGYSAARIEVEKDLAKSKAEGRTEGSSSALGDFGLQGDEYLSSIPIRWRDTVRAIAEGRQQVPAGKWGEALREAAFHYKPDLRGQTYGGRAAAERNFSAGEAVRNVRAINTLIGHLGRLSDNIPTLNNSSFRLANKAFNAWAKESGDPRVAPILADVHAVAEELGRVFKGTVTEGEVNRMMTLLDAAQSPEQLQSVVHEFVQLMNSRLEALQSEYQRTTGRSEEESNLLTPHSKETLGKLDGGASQTPPGGKLIGNTPEGKPVYQLPDGSKVVAK